MGEAAAKLYYTAEEYLMFEELAKNKSEFYNGKIFAMSGTSGNHSIICFNLNRHIGEAIDNRNCTGFDSNMKLNIAQANSFVYPDLMVVCGDIDFFKNRTDIITNPILIIEVLSPSTQAFDRSKKFEYYRSVTSMREYVLVSQEEPMIEIFFRQNEKIWLYSAVKGLEARVVLQTIEHELALKDIYRKVDWNQPAL
ncbi:MAG: hypothetical protein BWK80_57255 [Desulfobacteraceae bacterium IS3]|nr:MAG: hypothetical protein BWK80_57255 [Desulfobacteraceae bacterium IS3]